MVLGTPAKNGRTLPQTPWYWLVAHSVVDARENTVTLRQYARGRRRLAIVATLAITVAVLASCSSSKSSPSSGGTASGGSDMSLVSSGYLTVANYGTISPFVIDRNDGSLGGLEGQLFNGFAKAHNLKVKVINTTFASMILDVQQHKADVASFVYYSPERAKQLYYTSSFVKITAGVFTKRSFNYTGPDSLRKVKVGVVTGQLWQAALQKALGSNLVLYSTQTEAAQALVNGQISAYVNGQDEIYSPPLSTHSSDIVYRSLAPGSLGMTKAMLENVAYNAVSCSNSGLAKSLDHYLSQLYRAGTWTSYLRGNGPDLINLPRSYDVVPTPPTELCG